MHASADRRSHPWLRSPLLTSSYVRLDRRTLGIAILAAYGVGLWTHLVHWRSGAREAHDVTFWAHWMRDSTLSVPLVLHGSADRDDVRRSTRPRIVRTAIGTGAAVATALAMGVPVHAGIFGHSAHHGPVPPLPVSMMAEFLIDLPVALLIAAAVVGAGAIRLAEAPCPTVRHERIALAMAALFAVGIVTMPTSPASAVTPPSVCPAGSVTRP